MSSDMRWLVNVAMPHFGIKRVKVTYKETGKKWPDIWVSLNKIPVITVTEEWVRQSVHERRKRLVHEFLHVIGYRHGKINGLDYHTVPQFDTFSKKVYGDIVNGN